MSSPRIIPSQKEGFSHGESMRGDVLAVDLRTAVMRTSRRLRVETTYDDIAPRQYMVLARLRDGPQTLRELAEREHVQAPSMTRIFNALTDQGFTTRTVHPWDGHQILAGTTPAGEDVFAGAREQRTDWPAQWMAGLSEEERLILSRAAHLMQLSAK